MSKAMVTFGVGPHEALLEIAKPSFDAFAQRHGYDFYIADPGEMTRPAPWYKYPTLIALLQKYDDVLWIGADMVIVDGREDFIDDVPAEAWQAMVKHHTGDGEVPNTEFWLVRKPMIEVLNTGWDLRHYLTHGWWEQAALLELMGYIVTSPLTRLYKPTEVYDHTHFLDNSWNVHTWDRPKPTYHRIQHATMHEDRTMVMNEWAKEAESWIDE